MGFSALAGSSGPRAMRHLISASIGLGEHGLRRDLFAGLSRHSWMVRGTQPLWGRCVHLRPASKNHALVHRCTDVGYSVTMTDIWGRSTTWRRWAKNQKPSGWPLPIVTIKCGVTVRPVELPTATVTESSELAASEVVTEQDRKDQRRRHESKGRDRDGRHGRGASAAIPSKGPEPFGCRDDGRPAHRAQR